MGVEIKRRDAPRKSRSMEIAMHDLGLNELIVVYPGARNYELGENIKAMSLEGAILDFKKNVKC